MKVNSRRFCEALLVLSGVVILILVVLRVGIGATAYDATDSAGRKMGFNDPLSLEHYEIMIRNFSPLRLIQAEYFYEWILFAVYAIGWVLIFSRKHFGSRSTRWFFAFQGLIFPMAWFGLLWFPNVLKDMAAGKMDRESFIDIPFLWVTAHSVWLITSIIIVFVMPGESMGIKTSSERLVSFLAARLK